jgi:8-oxo-dGTP diphosphatase
MNTDYPKGGIGVFVVNSTRDKMLIGKRKDTNTYAKPGGWLEFGETFEECGSRELKEEANIDISPDRLFHIKTYNCYDPMNNYHNVAIYLYCEITKEEESDIVNMEPHKNDFWVWVDFGFILENKDKLFFPFREFLVQFKEINSLDELKKLIYIN